MEQTPPIPLLSKSPIFFRPGLPPSDGHVPIRRRRCSTDVSLVVGLFHLTASAIDVSAFPNNQSKACFLQHLDISCVLLSSLCSQSAPPRSTFADYFSHPTDAVAFPSILVLPLGPRGCDAATRRFTR